MSNSDVSHLRHLLDTSRGTPAWAKEVLGTVRDLARCRITTTSKLIYRMCSDMWPIDQAEVDARLGGPYDERSEYDPVVAGDPDRWSQEAETIKFSSGPVYVGSIETDAHNLAWRPRARMALTVEATRGVVDLVDALLRADRMPPAASAWGVGLADAIEAARGGQRDGLLRVRAAAAVVDDEFRRAVRRRVIDEEAARHLMVFPPDPTAEIARIIREGEIDLPRSMAAGYPIRSTAGRARDDA